MESNTCYKLKKHMENSKNIDETISNFKPPIFWKEKDIVKQQISNWTIEDARELIYQINDMEYLIKKNNLNSLNIVSDFLLNKSNKLNSYSL